MKLSFISDLYCDNEPPEKKSISAFCFMMAGGVLTRRSKKKKTREQGSADAEFISLVVYVRKALWF